MGKKFACRTCRQEVTLDENGVANHLDGTTACVVEVTGEEMAGYDRHELIEDSEKEEVESNQEGG